MFKLLAFSAAVAIGASVVSFGTSQAQDFSLKSSGYHNADKRDRQGYRNKRHRRDRYERRHLRGSIAGVSQSSSIVISNDNAVEATQYERADTSNIRWYGPLNRVSSIVHISNDMVDLAESRDHWRASQGYSEQTKSIIVIAGAGDGSERIPEPVYMPDTYTQTIDEGAEIIHFAD